MKHTKLFAALAAAAMLTLNACKKDAEKVYADFGSIEIELDHRAGEDELEFGKYYTTGAGDSIQFSMFNYFISNIVLVKEDGSEYVVPQNESYFLVKHDVDATHAIEIDNVPGGAYKAVRFTIGVDSVMNTKPAEQRPTSLDPVTNAAGMYWAWNSGYIFVKVEGTSPQAPVNANTQERSVIYHIGGYGGNDPASPTMNNIKTVTLEKSGELAQVGKLENGTGIKPAVHTTVDILQIFKEPTAFKVADTPVMHWGDFAITLANNYKDMFAIDHIHN